MSDEIPIGSPPVPPGRHAAPGGWYPDPAQTGQERYWDGWQWSRQTREASGPPPGGPAGQPAHGQSWQGHPGQAGPGHGGPGHGGPGHSGPGQGAHGHPGYGAPGHNPYAQPQVSAKAWTTVDGVPLAGWWHRLGAMLIDSVLLTIVQMIVLSPIYVPAGERVQQIFAQMMRDIEAGRDPGQVQPTDIYSSGDQMIILVVTLALMTAYNLFLLKFRGATVGKMITGLRVVPVDQGQAPRGLSWGSAVMRTMIWVAPYLSGCLYLLQIVDGLFPLWQNKRQALHDLAAKTQVVRSR
ncbi:RDD family protein [Propionibacteriaceae bacterium Y1685]